MFVGRPWPPLSAPPETPAARDYWPTYAWRSAEPETLGLDGGRLAVLRDAIHADHPDIYSVLVVRHGRIAFEEYYQGFYPKFKFEIASITKSITATLVGIAPDRGLLHSLD